MDACALALALGTAGLVAMTVLGFHHRPTAAPARRDGAEAPAPPTKLPARPGRAAGDSTSRLHIRTALFPGTWRCGMIDESAVSDSIPVPYKGFAITVRTFQIRGSGRWTLDLLIGRRDGLRSFSGPVTYPSQEAAITGCREFARRIIDGRVRDCSVADLS
jgi:hypothetical protein